MRIVSLPQIRDALAGQDLLPAIEAGFAAYSRGEVVVPPVGELVFRDPPGDTHIKYGYVIGDDSYVIKIASGFYDNPKLGLPGNSGLMLMFSQRTGELRSILLDEGHLTNVRTAIAGAVCAKHLAPAKIERIAVFGTGVQARMQVEALARITDCRLLSAWGRGNAALDTFAADMRAQGWSVDATDDVALAAAGADVIVTTTAAEVPFLCTEHVRDRAHITAMGSDTEHKNELHPDLLGAADLYVADSRSQCATRGELHHAIRAGTRTIEACVELGEVIDGRVTGRTDADQVTIADLTGVAVQDIQIAKAVEAALAAIGSKGAMNVR